MPKNTKKAEVPSRKRRKKLPLQQKIRTIMETDEFFTTGEKRCSSYSTENYCNFQGKHSTKAIAKS